MLKKLAVISLTAGVLVLAAPAVASAASSAVPASTATSSYAEEPRVSIDDAIIDVCEVSTISFGAGYFTAGERVGVSVSGLDSADASISGNTAGADGSLVVTFRPPSDGDGTYGVTFSGSERSYTATVTVTDADCDHDPGAAPAGTELSDGDSGLELALTGGSVSPWILGGGALALAAGGVLVAAGVVRRRRA